MSRITLAGIVLGGVLAFCGFQEWRVSQGTTAEPIAVELTKLESGEVPENSHVKVGEHVAVYGATVYECRQSRSDKGPPNASSKVTHCYYPILSPEHKYFQKIAAAIEKHGSTDAVPNSEWPELEEFTVLVKSKQFDKLGDIPDGFGNNEGVQGLIINRISSLDSEEEMLVKSSFPKLDTSKLLLLEADRKPATAAKSFGMMTGGVLLSLLGIGGVVKRARSS